MPDLEPLLRLWRALDDLFAAEERTWWGAVVSDPRYPDVQEANYARVETAQPVALEEIEASLVPALSGVGCRRCTSSGSSPRSRPTCSCRPARAASAWCGSRDGP